MSYAIRNDGQGWRAVEADSDCTENEHFSLVQPAPVALTDAQQLEIAFEKVRIDLQKSIDDKAKLLGFSGGNALMLYVGFNNAFTSIATTFAQWEASVWVEAGAYKNQVLAAESPMLTPEEAVAMMPPITW